MLPPPATISILQACLLVMRSGWMRHAVLRRPSFDSAIQHTSSTHPSEPQSQGPNKQRRHPKLAFSRLSPTRPSRMATKCSDLRILELEHIAEALGDTTWISLFSRVSKACRDASDRVEEDEAALSQLNVCDLVGTVELAAWALEQGCPRRQGRSTICAAAARGGHLETLKFLRANGCEWDSDTCSSAARGGHLEVLKYLRANGCEWDEQTCCSAARGGHLEVLKCLRANGCEWDEETCSSAAFGGHLEVLQWARANGCEWSGFTCARAARGGHLEVLKWAKANGCKWDKTTCSQAAYGGHLEVLQWLRANGCKWDKTICFQAAYGGHLEVLQWARANGCKWDESTCSQAAYGGHLEVLQWARANGCKWDEEECYVFAANRRHHKVLEWMRQPN